MRFYPENIPPELRQCKRWCCWRSVPDDKGKPQKRPWKLDGLGPLVWSSPANLLTFDEALEAYLAGLDLPEHKGQHFAGIGYILPEGTTELRLVCIDLDNSFNDAGELSPGAKKILEKFGGYVEYSPSGRGLHIWVKATLPTDFRNISTKDGGKPLDVDGQKVELFVRKHFVTVTGNVYQAGAIEDRTSTVLELYALKRPDDRPPEHSWPRSGPVDDRYRHYAETALESAAKNVRDAQEGNRNNTLNVEAFGMGQLVGVGILDEYEVERALFRAATSNGLPESEARATIKSGLGDGKKEPRNVVLEGRQRPEGQSPERQRPDAQPREPEHLTEGGNASRLVRLHGKDLRYCHTWKKWLVWDGSIWRPDLNGKVYRLAADVVKDLYSQAARVDDLNLRKELVSFARGSDRRQHYRNVLDLAACRLPLAITADALDTNPWLAVAGDVAIDLKTLETRTPTREDLSTKSLGTRYDPSATCPTWDRFISETFGNDEELISYIKRAVGYSLTGSMAEQVFFFCHGVGANGKSTFLAVVRALMGDYAYESAFSTFLAQDRDRIRNDLAALVGARLVTAIEAEDGSRLSMQVLKAITGGDPITCRFLFGEMFTYRPTFKIWLAANNKPAISERNYAAWRRVHLIPFKNVVPPEKRDGELEAKLLKELPGILNWALEGLKDYHETGLTPPQAVQAATEEYRRENDNLQSFVGECCRVDKLAVCRNVDLYAAYQGYCRDLGQEPLSQTKFSNELKACEGIAQSRDERGRIWLGISFLSGCNRDALPGCHRKPQSFNNFPRMENFGGLADIPDSDSDSNPTAYKPDSPTRQPGEEDQQSKEYGEVGQAITKTSLDRELRKSEERRKENEEHFKQVVARPPWRNKHHCSKCNRDFEYDLIPYYNGDERGYICSSCSMGHGPEPPRATDPQKKLADKEATA